MKGWISFDGGKVEFAFGVPFPAFNGRVVGFHVEPVAGWASKDAPKPGTFIAETSPGVWAGWQVGNEYGGPHRTGLYLGDGHVLLPGEGWPAK